MIWLPLMNRPFDLSAAALGCMLLGGCGPSAQTPMAATSPSAAKADVIVTMDGQHHDCVVALHSEAQGSTIACDDAMPFIRDQLRVPTGGSYDIRTIPEVDNAERAKLEAGLQGAGYHPIAGSN
jgi:hypothetical protein